MPTPKNAKYKKLQRIGKDAHRRAYAVTPGNKLPRTGGRFLGYIVNAPHPKSRGRQNSLPILFGGR